MSQSSESQVPVCPRCQGTGQCNDCHGTGSIDCLACKGVGHETTSTGRELTCKVCSGSGKLACPPQCPSCGGSGQITPQFQENIRQIYQPAANRFASSKVVTNTMVALCVVVYLLCPRDIPALLPQPWPWLIWNKLVNQPNVLFTMELWRFLTPAFLHGSIWHLAANMYFLITVGPTLESILGWKRYLTLYLVSALAGNALSWIMAPGAGVGASTALFGIGAAYVGLHWRWGTINAAAANYIGKALVLILIAGVLLGGSFGLRLDNWGHLGGGLAGLLLAYLGPRPGK